MEKKVVLVSLGGFPGLLPELDATAGHFPDVVFVAPAARDKPGGRENVISLPRQSEISHVEIMAAADALVCKAGYSTLAEGYCAGIPVAAIVRDGYPETPALAAFVKEKMAGICLPSSTMIDGGWSIVLPEVLGQERRPPRPSAAGKVARFLLDLP